MVGLPMGTEEGKPLYVGEVCWWLHHATEELSDSGGTYAENCAYLAHTMSLSIFVQ